MLPLMIVLKIGMIIYSYVPVQRSLWFMYNRARLTSAVCRKYNMRIQEMTRLGRYGSKTKITQSSRYNCLKRDRKKELIKII